jgi:unsaturated rhamnogalacturonyl hydrolase
LLANLVFVIGLTAHQAPMQAFITPDDLNFGTSKMRVLLVGDPRRVTAAAKLRTRFAISAVRMDGLKDLQFPPQGEAYKVNPEAHYLWRWIHMHAPDAVVQFGDGNLAEALNREGIIPASAAPGQHFLPKTLAPSPSRLEMQRRLARTPEQVARDLTQYYGRKLDDVVYIEAVPLLARLRLGDREDVERILAPFVKGGKPGLPAKPTASHLSGHLVFGELALETSNPRYVDLVRAAADVAAGPGSIYTEMSDGVFMGCPILARAGRLTHERKYFDDSARVLRVMQSLQLRPDGLYRHSPLSDAAWGRGNAFPALGVAMALGDLPLEDPSRAFMLHAFQTHMAALLKHQDITGMWHQVIDAPGSYREFSATAMILVAMRRGVRAGWLDKAQYELPISKAWEAVKLRIAPQGVIIDVCTGTGKQKSLQDYLDRPAILGFDPRGGAMALLAATEMMQ